MNDTEKRRLDALHAFHVVDTGEEDAFDEIAKVAAQVCLAPVAFIGFLESDREWFKASWGWKIRELPRQVTFSEAVVESFAPVFCADAQADPRFAQNPLVARDPNVRFYAGLPLITADGFIVGVLSVYDRVPKQLTQPQIAILKTLAEQVMTQLVLRQQRVELERRAMQIDEVKDSLRDSEERFRDLFDNVDDIIMSISPEGRILHVNAAWYNAFEFSPDDLRNLHILDTIHPDHRDEFTRNFKLVVAAASQQKIETVFLTNGGRRFTVDGTLIPKVVGDHTILVRVIFRDVTERKMFEIELARARDAALESARLKSQFLTNVSHEIRTPMNGIVGMLQLLLDSQLSDEQKEFAQTALSSADELMAILNNILQMSKIEAGKLSTAVTDFDLLKTVERVVEVMRVMASAKNIPVDLRFDPTLPNVVFGDVGALRQILTNVIGNAVKFTEEGRVEVRVTIERETDTHHIIRFAIADTGIGIREEEQAKLFKSFSQIDGSVTRKYGGVGLGLATSRQLVELMGGVIGVESRVLKGSTFWFTIPFEKRLSQRVGSAATLEVAGMRALVIDQSETSKRIIRHYLQTVVGMRVDVADGGVEALEILRMGADLGDPYRLAIFDLHMPGMHGLALAEEVRRDPRIAATALIGMVGLGEEVDDEIMREVGIGAYLSKPVEQTELLDALTVVMAKELRPIATSGRAAAPKSEAQQPEAGSARDFAHKILLAEDNALNQKLTLSQLQKLGYEVDVVANGAEVLEALGRDLYPVILMDCQMPVMDGYEATMQIRRLEGAHRRTRIIAMTAHALEGDREKCLAAGMDDYLSKPTRQQDLAAALARWMPG